MTVRQALGDLERDGLLRRVVGRAGGTFVREPGSVRSAGRRGRPLGRAAPSGWRQRRSSRSRPRSSRPGRRVAAALELKRSDRVVVITRLRLAGGKPLAVERSTLPSAALLGHRGHGSERLALRPDGRRVRPAAGERGREARARRGAALRRAVARRPPRRAAAPRRADRATRPTGRRSSSRATGSAPTAPGSRSNRPDLRMIGSESEVERPRRRHRRRCRRVLDPLLAHPARLGRRRPRRARRPDERLDVPLGRARRPAAELAGADADDDELGRALPHARGRGRARDGLARGRLAAPRLLARAAGGDHAPGRLGEDVRAPARARLGGRGAGAVPADVDGRRPRSRLPPERRLHRPEPAHLRARRGRAAPRRRGQHHHARDGDHDRSGAR